MKQSPPVGTTGELEVVVDETQAIHFDGLPAVLSTPSLVMLLECAARDALPPFLDEGESSVGAQIELQHLAPTPVGMRVTCRARVINSEGRLISFQIEARDEKELIARGLHKRSVLDVARFGAAVERKRDSQT